MSKPTLASSFCTETGPGSALALFDSAVPRWFSFVFFMNAISMRIDPVLRPLEGLAVGRLCSRLSWSQLYQSRSLHRRIAFA